MILKSKQKNMIRNKIYRKLCGLFKLHPTSYPYISGDGFRSMANHIYDDSGKCDPSKIKNYEVVFLKTDFMDEWFEDAHPHINAKYKLITHNSDRSVGEREANLIDDKIIHWFAQNNTFPSSKDHTYTYRHRK